MPFPEFSSSFFCSFFLFSPSCSVPLSFFHHSVKYRFGKITSWDLPTKYIPLSCVDTYVLLTFQFSFRNGKIAFLDIVTSSLSCADSCLYSIHIFLPFITMYPFFVLHFFILIGGLLPFLSCNFASTHPE